MADLTLSLQDVFEQVGQLDILPLPTKVSGLAALITAPASNESGPVRVFLQGSLCGALLKSLRPSLPTQSAPEVTQTRPCQTAAQTSPSNAQPSTTPATGPHAAEACWASSASALQTIYSWEDEEVVLAIIEFWNTASGCLSGSWLQQPQHLHQQQQQQTPASASQDTSIVDASRHSRPLQGNPPAGPPAHPSTAATAAAAYQEASSGSPELQYLSWLWALGPAGVAAVVQQLHKFWQMTGLNPLQHHKGAAHHNINLLLLFLHLHETSTSSSTDTSSLQPAQQLLRLLQPGQHGMACSFPVASLAAAITAGEAFAGVCCLLQAATMVQSTLPAHAGPTAAAAETGEGSQEAPQLQSNAGGSAAGTAATVGVLAPAWQQLAEAAGLWLRNSYGWCGFAEAASTPAAAAAAAAEAAKHAAAGFGAGTAAATVTRPSTVDSLYDCFMMLLLQHMLAGPTTSNTHQTTSNSHGSNSPCGTGRIPSSLTQRSLSLHAGAASTTAAAETAAGQGWCSGGSAAPQSGMTDDDWECWAEGDACTALAALVATYDRPEVLSRGLHILTQQQLAAAENAAATAAAAAEEAGGPVAPVSVSRGLNKGTAAAAKKAEKAAMGRALLLLQRVFGWRQHQQYAVASAAEADSSGVTASNSSSSRAMAGGVHELLIGLGELLRPAANCSVEWRCAALAAMLAAVEEFTEQTADADDLQLLLWSDTSVESLLYCASHDPSIQARRAAVQLLQHVVLPHNSSTARALIRCLAEKLCDKDSGVAAAALQLFVQLDPKALCSCLTAAQWCASVQAALQMLCGAGGVTGTQTQGGRGGRSKAQADGAVGDGVAKQQFGRMLKKVLVSVGPAGPQQQQQLKVCGWQWLTTQGGRVVGMEGCRQVLLLMMQEPGLEPQWQALV